MYSNLNRDLFMKFWLVVLGLIVAACAAPSPTPAPGPDLAAEERAIRAADSTWLAAAVRHDAAGEAALFSDDAIAYRDQADPITGPAAYQTYLAQYYVDNPQVATNWVTRSITVAASGDLAVQTGTFTEANAGAKGDVTRQNNFVTVWKKVNGQWRVAIDIGQPIAAAKPKSNLRDFRISPSVADPCRATR
jgi:ketosteroid isomerase-like protein